MRITGKNGNIRQKSRRSKKGCAMIILFCFVLRWEIKLEYLFADSFSYITFHTRERAAVGLGEREAGGSGQGGSTEDCGNKRRQRTGWGGGGGRWGMPLQQPQSFTGKQSLVGTASPEGFSSNNLLSFLIFYSTIEVLLQGYLKANQRQSLRPGA